jgi:N-methylhydantoinase A
MVPPHPGVFSAFGLLVAGLRMDYVTDTGGWSSDRLEAEEVMLRLSALMADAARDFAAIGGDRDALELRPSVEARYPGQGYELRVPLDADAMRAIGPAHIAQEFHARHARRYGHAFRDQPVEVVNLRLEARSAPPLPGTMIMAEAEAEAAAPGRRRVRLGGADADCALIGRGALKNGQEAAGPALIGESTTTTLLPAGWVARASRGGPMQLRREAAL